MPPVKDLNRYTQNFSNQNNNIGKLGGGLQPNNNYPQSTHQQFFNQYADHTHQPLKNNYSQNPTSHVQHNHQQFFNDYSVGTGQQPPNLRYPPSNPPKTNYFPSNPPPPTNQNSSNYGINQTNSVITTGYNTTVLNTKTTTTQQQGFSYQPSSYNNNFKVDMTKG